MKKAIIYVRGHNQEMQEIICKLYAAENMYNIQFVTDDIASVCSCDVLIAANPSRISRNSMKYHETIKLLEKRGIVVEYASNHENIGDMLEFARKIII